MFKEKLLFIYSKIIYLWPIILICGVLCIIAYLNIAENKMKRSSVLLTQELIKEEFLDKDCISIPNKIEWACQNSIFKCIFNGDEIFCEMKTERGIKVFRLKDEIDINSIKK